MRRYEDLPPHLRPHDEPSHLYEELPLLEELPLPEIGRRGDRAEEPAPAPPADPFLRR